MLLRPLHHQHHQIIHTLCWPFTTHLTSPHSLTAHRRLLSCAPAFLFSKNLKRALKLLSIFTNCRIFLQFFFFFVVVVVGFHTLFQFGCAFSIFTKLHFATPSVIDSVVVLLFSAIENLCSAKVNQKMMILMTMLS